MASARPQRIDPRTVGTTRAVPPAAKGRGRSGKPGGRTPQTVAAKATWLDWVGAARIPTLPLSIAPVLLGTAAARLMPDPDVDGGWHWLRAIACLTVAVCMQIAVNFANDYSDGVRGTDAFRNGPRRLVASGAARPRTVLAVAITFFALAAVAGLIVTIRSEHWWFLALGALSIAAAWFYTGGKRPYGYHGFGELAVFVFFGLAATVGTTYALVSAVPLEAWLVAVAAGCFAAAVLGTANLRDRDTDARVGKRTLAVRIGDRGARILVIVLLVVPYLVAGAIAVFYDNAFYAFFTLLITAPVVLIVATAKTARELVLALRLIGLATLSYALLLGWAIGF